MITVDCGEAEAIMHELSVHVADGVGAIPAMKLHGFALAALDGGDGPDAAAVAESVRGYLDSIGEGRDFAVTASGGAVHVRSVSGRRLERAPAAGGAEGPFSCPHCGFVTRYEEEYSTHKLVHYL